MSLREYSFYKTTVGTKVKWCSLCRKYSHLVQRSFKYGRTLTNNIQNCFTVVECRVCRTYFTTYLSQDRMFRFLFLQNFLRILRPRFWVCSAVSLALQSAQRAQFELWRDLSWFIRNDVYQKTKVYIRVQNFKFDV